MTSEKQDTSTETEYNEGIEAIRLAHQLETQAQIARQNRHNEELRRAVNTEAVPSLAKSSGEDVGSNLAIKSPTTINNHYHLPTASAAPAPGATEQKTTEAPKPKKSALAKLGRVALIAGLLGTGASLPFVATIAASILRPKTPAAPAPSEPTAPADSVDPVRYSLDLGE